MADARAKLLHAFEEQLVSKYGGPARAVAADEVARLRKREKIQPADLAKVEEIVADYARDSRLGRASSYGDARSVKSHRSGSDARSIKSHLSRARSLQSAPRSLASSGASITGSRENLLRTPRFEPPAPLPIRKPQQEKRADQWDLILRYDHSKFTEEERLRIENRRTEQMRYKAELDHQMQGINDRRDYLAEERLRDRDALLLEQERILRDEELERKRLEAKNKACLDGCKQALEMRQRKLDREQAKADQEKAELHAQVRREELEDEQKEALRKARLQHRAKEIQQHLKDDLELKRKQKVAEQEDNKKMMARYARELEQKEEARQAALDALKERMKRIANTVGKAVGDSMAKKEREDELRMLATVKAAEEKAKEAEEEKNRVRQERNRALHDSLKQQMQLKEVRRQKELAELALQGKIWKEESETALKREADEVQSRIDARAQLDKDLITQICRDGDEENRMMPIRRAQEQEVNQDIFRQMLADGFDPASAKAFLLPPRTKS